jgi:hypothetical protein
MSVSPCLKELIDAEGWTCREFEWPDRYYFGESRTLVDAETADATDPDVVEAGAYTRSRFSSTCALPSTV